MSLKGTGTKGMGSKGMGKSFPEMEHPNAAQQSLIFLDSKHHVKIRLRFLYVECMFRELQRAVLLTF